VVPWPTERNLDQFSRVFAQLTRVHNTHTHTDHATCDICSNRPHLMHCMQALRPKNNICNQKLEITTELEVSVPAVTR